MGVRPMGRGKSAMWMAGLGRPPNGGHRGLAPAGGIVHAGYAPHFHFETSKRKCAAPGGKEKMSRRVGLRRRRPPAAGGGRLAIPRGGQRRKRPALGETFSPGKSGIHAALIFAAAGRWLMKVSSRANAIVSTTARAARSEAERAEREAGQMRSCTPTTSAPSATGRQSGKSQKSIACPKARPNRSRHWYADPRTRGGPLHRSAPGAFFSYTGRGAFSFWRNQKENGGRIAQLAPQLNPPGG